MSFEFSADFAKKMDASDPLLDFRSEFEFPQHEGKNVLYFTGNSLGLMPKKARAAVESELNNWSQLAVEGHFKGDNPWFHYHKLTKQGSAYMVGAEEEEVVVMNGLTVNLHLMMVSFYQPTAKRFKIICEEKAFPSDQYVFETQAKFHGFNPEEAIIEVGPREGETYIREEDIISTIKEHGDEVALVLFGGINYYTGQRFDIKEITRVGQEVGAKVGWDLAHAAGNIELELHKWNVDFACWCTYKYLNSGPGAQSGVFVHKRYANDHTLNRFAGWWGYDQATRFRMEKNFVPMKGADGWQLSNGPILAFAPHKCALEQFMRAQKENLFAKRDKLTGYLEFILEELASKYPDFGFKILTPKNPKQRGSQISLYVENRGKEIFDYLIDNGVIPDWREPNVLRFAPVPMYNSFEDVYQLGSLMREVLEKLK
ncbi:kynureninase [Luteibaculum oceani]|uniref:Kynureninase n=1 Tax=Luteibaculum oceani TaxID=1294296 RepID=A0A5C6V8Q5_9FLAO|nr:kynureninase [Luteibaculum oceani]TXC81792.1 kynureninase [Luteibaculum oceani]